MLSWQFILVVLFSKAYLFLHHKTSALQLRWNLSLTIWLIKLGLALKFWLFRSMVLPDCWSGIHIGCFFDKSAILHNSAVWIDHSIQYFGLVVLSIGLAWCFCHLVWPQHLSTLALCTQHLDTSSFYHPYYSIQAFISFCLYILTLLYLTTKLYFHGNSIVWNVMAKTFVIRCMHNRWCHPNWLTASASFCVVTYKRYWKMSKESSKVIALKNLPYKQWWTQLNLPTSKYRRLRGDMTQVFEFTDSYRQIWHNIAPVLSTNTNIVTTNQKPSLWSREVSSNG